MTDSIRNKFENDIFQFSLASFKKEMSCGYRIFTGAQVASMIRVPPSVVSSSGVGICAGATGCRRCRTVIILMPKHIFIGLVKDIHGNPFTEPYKRACVKRSRSLVSRKTDEILRVQILG